MEILSHSNLAVSICHERDGHSDPTQTPTARSYNVGLRSSKGERYGFPGSLGKMTWREEPWLSTVMGLDPNSATFHL